MWGSGGTVPPFLTSALDGGEWSAPHPSRFIPGERARGTHWIGGCMGPRVGLDAVEERRILHCWELNPCRPARSPSVCRLINLDADNAVKTNLKNWCYCSQLPIYTYHNFFINSPAVAFRLVSHLQGNVLILNIFIDYGICFIFLSKWRQVLLAAVCSRVLHPDIKRLRGGAGGSTDVYTRGVPLLWIPQHEML
jgi:hypothetical protein